VVCRDFIANERNILAFTDNPFVVKLYYSFQSANNLYMVMEFLPGGDCFSLLRNLIVFPEVPPPPQIPFAVSCLRVCVRWSHVSVA
jgi:serine/threonine protein kinase